jgi:OPA family glycerol-3-phosphate transporter-like MFS transporter
MKNRRLAVWQGLTIALLFIGYAGYYLCRSDFSVSLPLIIDELAAHGMTPSQAQSRLAVISSLGVLAYAIGKFFLAGVADFLGGKRNFLIGMGGSILFTILFSLAGGMPVFTLAWVGNRLVQSAGWAGTVKITSRWFSYSSYGAAMGAVSLSYLFGDAAARQFMGFLIGHGFGWRAVFQVAAGTLFVIFIANLLLLKESRAQIGLAEPEVNPLNLFGAEGGDPKPSSLRDLLAPLFRSPAFWMVCALSLGTTLVRETFNTWTPTYFNHVVGYSKSEAAGMSAVFPLFGGVSVLLSGFWSDRLGRSGRSAIMFYSLLLSSAALFALGSLRAGGGQALPTFLVGSVGFLVIGPYAYLAGAIALDFGGKHGSATASGIIDGVGYLGGILAGGAVSSISLSFGWTGAFLALAGVALLSSGAAALLLINQRRRVPDVELA